MKMEKLKYIWHNFMPQICDLLKELQQSKKFCDVTLVCDDQKQLKAHKFILSACSSVFKNMFENGDSTSSTIYLRGIKSQDMDSVLQFLYLGDAVAHLLRFIFLIRVLPSHDIRALRKGSASMKTFG